MYILVSLHFNIILLSGKNSKYLPSSDIQHCSVLYWIFSRYLETLLNISKKILITLPYWNIYLYNYSKQINHERLCLMLKEFSFTKIKGNISWICLRYLLQRKKTNLIHSVGSWHFALQGYEDESQTPMLPYFFNSDENEWERRPVIPCQPGSGEVRICIFVGTVVHIMFLVCKM